MESIENNVSKFSFIDARAFIAMVTSLLSRYLAMTGG
jgi:hypothetical protein